MPINHTISTLYLEKLLYNDILTLLVKCNIVLSCLFNLYIHSSNLYFKCFTDVFFQGESLRYLRYATFRYLLLHSNVIHYVLYSHVCSSSLLGANVSTKHDFFCKLNPLSQRVLPFHPLIMPVYMTEATLNANNNVDICLIPLKFDMWVSDMMTNMYT